MKIINISLHRTATTSFHIFCQKNKIKSIHWAGKEFDKLNEDCLNTLDYETTWKRYSNNLLNEFDAHSDLPCPFLFKQAARDVPTARFVLMLRNPSDWIQSIRRHTIDRELDVLEKLMYARITDGKKKKYLSEYSDKELENGLINFVSMVSHTMHEMRVPFFKIFSLEDPDVGKKLAAFLDFQNSDFFNINKQRMEKNRL